MVISVTLTGTCSVVLENQDSPMFMVDPTRPICRDRFVAMLPGCSEKASMLLPSVLHDQNMPHKSILQCNAGKKRFSSDETWYSME